jgi:phage shock protein PspC (stress-responsive transcriptional regulator)
MVRGAPGRDLGPMPETPSSSDPERPAGSPASDEAPTTSMPGPDAAPRRLLRSRDDRVIGGVCGGLAQYFRIDPLIVRIAAVALAFVGGASIIAYLAALLLVPADDGTGHPARERPSRVGTIAGVVLIVLAGIALLDGNFGWHGGWAFAGLIPLAIVAGLLAIGGQRLLRARGESHPSAQRLVGAALAVLGIIIGVAVVASGAAWATAAGGGWVVAGTVIVLGAAMVVLSLRQHSARWLAVPALALAIPAGVVAAAGVDLKGGAGERTYRPATTGDVRPGTYRLGTGELVVDLRNTDWPRGAQVDLNVKVGAGHALVLVPSDVCVQSRTHVGLGYVNVLGDDSGGADVDDERGTLLRSPGGRRLLVNADMGIGAIEVLHRRHHNDFGDGTRASISSDLAAAGCAGAAA